MNKSNTKKSSPLLSCRQVCKSFGNEKAVDNVDFDMDNGELVAVLGPSGCGKSTLLRIIAGLESTDAGTVLYRGGVWSNGAKFVTPEKRDCGLVFQDLALFPHLSVQDNIGFGVDADRKARTVAEMLKVVNLVDSGSKMMHMLSGGQQQRVALARSLAPNPRLLLLDEPFSSLDLQLREQMRSEVRGILKKQNVSAILVTHDQNEAFSFADRVAVMRRGKIRQIGTPDDIYLKPATDKIADFVGEANFLRVIHNQGDPDQGKMIWLLGSVSVGFPKMIFTIMFRPEDVRVAITSEKTTDRIVDIQFQGEQQRLTISLETGETILAHTPSRQKWRVGQSVRVIVAHACSYDKEGILLGCHDLTETK